MSKPDRPSLSRRTVVSSLAGAAAIRWPNPLRQDAPADLILHDGDIHLVDRAFRRVEAIALGGGRVLAAGTTAEVRRRTGPRTASVNLRGRTVQVDLTVVNGAVVFERQSGVE